MVDFALQMLFREKFKKKIGGLAEREFDVAILQSSDMFKKVILIQAAVLIVTKAIT